MQPFFNDGLFSMSTRSFIFCDVCNPRGIRCPEQRRDASRKDIEGRRITDARSWFEGDSEKAVSDNKWQAVVGGFHICPSCSEKGLHADNLPNLSSKSHRTFIFCDCCNPQGFRFVDNRRDDSRTSHKGRRITDGRAWIDDMNAEELVKYHWNAQGSDTHYCPKCVELHPSLTANTQI